MEYAWTNYSLASGLIFPSPVIGVSQAEVEIATIVAAAQMAIKEELAVLKHMWNIRQIEPIWGGIASKKTRPNLSLQNTLDMTTKTKQYTSQHGETTF